MCFTVTRHSLFNCPRVSFMCLYPLNCVMCEFVRACTVVIGITCCLHSCCACVACNFACSSAGHLQWIGVTSAALTTASQAPSGGCGITWPLSSITSSTIYRFCYSSCHLSCAYKSYGWVIMSLISLILNVRYDGDKRTWDVDATCFGASCISVVVVCSTFFVVFCSRLFL